MSNTLHALGGAGPGVPLFAAGKEWFFSMVGPGVRADFAAWGRLHARRQLAAVREDYTPQEFKRQESLLQDKILAGHYAWGTPLEEIEPEEGVPGGCAMGEGLQQLWQTTEGQLTFLKLLLREKHGEVSAKDLAAIVADNKEGFEDALQEALWLFPNCHAPAAQELTAGLDQRRQWQVYRTLEADVAKADPQWRKRRPKEKAKLWADAALARMPQVEPHPGTAATT